jgi:serine/threonine protein kinase
MNCPNRDVLLAFRTGELSEAAAEEAIPHISVCADCQATLQTFGDADDTFIAKLRSPAVADPYADEPQRAALMARAMALATGNAPGSSQTPAETLEAADLGRLGEYQLLAKLGEGGMGTVYKARQTRLKKIVALKVLPKERTADPRAVTRFEREMEAIGQLSHPNIVQAHDARDIDGTTVLVMEYVDGKDLAEVLQCVRSLRICDACEVVRQAALGLQYAHQHGMIHRDIKPSNLMLTVQGQVKILDLGLARLATEQQPEGVELTSSGAAMGTADYMAPEQASDAHTVDVRADIYSLGCALYKFLTGQAPFGGPQYATQVQKFLAHLSEPVPPVRRLRTEVPKALAAVLDRMLAKKPGDRMATTAEVAVALAPFTADCDLARLAADCIRHTPCAAASAPGSASVLAGTEPHASSAVVGTDAELPSPVHGRGAGGEGGQPNRRLGKLIPVAAREMAGKLVPLSLRQRIGVRGLIATAVGFSALVLLGVLLSLRTREGTLIVEVDDPSATVQVLNEKSEVVIERKGEKGSVTIGVAPGKGRLRLVKDGVELFAQDFSLVSGGKETIKARLEPLAVGPAPESEISNLKSELPPPAVAPFDAKKAKEHQAAWAKHLGVPVELTNSIGTKFG